VETVSFPAGQRIIAEGEAGATAYIILTGSVEVSVGHEGKAKTLGTLGPGDVFGEMSLIDPSPRSATVRAVTDVACSVVSLATLDSDSVDPKRLIELTRTLVRRLRRTNERIARIDSDTGHRIQQWLNVILAGIDEQDALSPPEMESLQRELRMLLQIEHFQIAAAEVEKAEEVLAFMLRPTIEECLGLWFGKVEETDREIWRRFGADVALASRGNFDHWALNLEHPRLLVALVIMLDQFRRNMYRETPEMYACDPRCLALVRRGLRVGIGSRLRPIERVFLCLALTHSEALEDQHLCMEEWGRAMDDLAPDDPLNAFHEIFHRHLAVVMRFGRFPHRNAILSRASTPAEADFLGNDAFRFDLPLVRREDGSLAFAGTVRKRTVKLLDHEYETLLPASGEATGAFEFKYSGPDAAFTRAQEELRRQGFVRIGDTVPDFTARTSLGPIRFHEFIGDNWCVLFSHPADFTPVCTTELGATARLGEAWERRGVKVIGLSVDGAEEHARWIADIEQTQGVKIDFPIIADKDRRVSMLFGMLDPTHFRHGPGLGETMAVRSVFVISPGKRVELVLAYPAHVGRSFEEILRVVDALQLSARHPVATPADWRPGEETVVLPFVSDEEAESLFARSGGVRRVRSYLRYVRDPSLRLL
jgi:alkyl hydroperoxide reductase subunit AhpC/uncharacterized protein (DUF924 family)/CRP-like cAMP-binding protein